MLGFSHNKKAKSQEVKTSFALCNPVLDAPPTLFRKVLKPDPKPPRARFGFLYRLTHFCRFVKP